MLAARPAPALHHNLPAGIELIYALPQLSQRDQMAAEVRNPILVRLAHIEQKVVFTRIALRFELSDGDLEGCR